MLKLEQEVQRLELAQAGQATLGEAKRGGFPVSQFSEAESAARLSGGMGSASEGVEDPEPGQAASDGHQWARPAPEPLFTLTGT